VQPSVGLVNGELALAGRVLRREVFAPVVDEVMQLLEDQLRRVGAQVDALLLVGGFAGSDYLFGRIQVCGGRRRRVPARVAGARGTACALLPAEAALTTRGRSASRSAYASSRARSTRTRRRSAARRATGSPPASASSRASSRRGRT
jgi:hypothetical protein